MTKGWFILKYINLHPSPQPKDLCHIFGLSRTEVYWYYKRARKKPPPKPIPLHRLPLQERVIEKLKAKHLLCL